MEHARTRTRKRATGRVASHRPLVIQHFLLESSSTVLVRDEIPYRRQRRLHLRANPTPDISHLGRLSWLLHLGLGFGLGKLEKSAKQKQYWILKCLQGGRDHPLAGMWGGDALLPSTGAERNLEIDAMLKGAAQKLLGQWGCAKTHHTREVVLLSTPHGHAVCAGRVTRCVQTSRASEQFNNTLSSLRPRWCCYRSASPPQRWQTLPFATGKRKSCPVLRSRGRFV